MHIEIFVFISLRCSGICTLASEFDLGNCVIMGGHQENPFIKTHFDVHSDVAMACSCEAVNSQEKGEWKPPARELFV